MCEAAQELDLLLDAIQYAKERTCRKGAVGDEPLHWPLQEGALAVSLEHAYHHLNFAWNGRFKTMEGADAQFARNEKFPRPCGAVGWFVKFWPKSFAHRFQILVRCKKYDKHPCVEEIKEDMSGLIGYLPNAER